MNILMVTNTYTPHVGGVAHSVRQFTEEYRRLGHRTMVLAPEFENMPADEVGTIRVPAIQNFNGSDFSVILPLSGLLLTELDAYRLDIVHAHHPFLLGTTALRIAHQFNVPLVFTHHTMYEQYTHYVPGDSQALKRFVVSLSSGYANMCRQVIAPSAGVERILRERGVETPIEVIPTGVDVESFAGGDREGFRARHGIDPGAWVVGHVGRLAPEKNIGFLSRSVADYLKSNPRGRFLVVGAGPATAEIERIFEESGVAGCLILTGSLEGRELIDAYRAMDVFVFASKTETQGMVLVEAMAAGLPVVALDATGVRDLVADGVQGRLLPREDEGEFVAAIGWVADLSPARRAQIVEAATGLARGLSMTRCAGRTVEVYARLLRESADREPVETGLWYRILEQIRTEWDILVNLGESVASAIPALNQGSETEGRDKE